jgi:chemotaxis protein methyltransferase CheR
VSVAADIAGTVLGRQIGLRVDGSSRLRLERAVDECAREAGQAPETWAAALESNPPYLQALIDRVTVQETAFFRHPEQFRILAEHLHGLEPPSAGIIWSAGCADGQEPWSLAMVLEEHGLLGWTVVATDVSRRALERAQAGIYTERQLGGLDDVRRARFLRREEGGDWSIVSSLRRRVRFLAHNLAGGHPPLEAADCSVVFCRNVLIYLRAQEARTLLANLHLRMPPDGLLVLGGAEALAPIDTDFVPERRQGAFVYRPRAVITAARERAAVPPVRRRPEPAAAVDPGPSAAEHAEAGERHAAAGDAAGAVTAFRRAVYLAPGDPVHHLRLALALDRAGDPAAPRAFRAARAALQGGGRRLVEQELGWSVVEVERMLEARLGRG